jgi:hypothetical protein
LASPDSLPTPAGTGPAWQGAGRDGRGIRRHIFEPPGQGEQRPREDGRVRRLIVAHTLDGSVRRGPLVFNGGHEPGFRPPMLADEGTKLLDRDGLAQIDGRHPGLILEIVFRVELRIAALRSNLRSNLFLGSGWYGRGMQTGHKRKLLREG